MGSVATVVVVLAVIIIGGVVLLAGWLISAYNKLVALKARFENAFAQINVQLTRRYDLIPNIVKVAKTYMEHESKTLQDVIEARNGAVASLKGAAATPGDPSSIEALNAAEKKLAGSFQGLRVQLEAYPDLKANTVMMQLSEELTSTENRVAFARQAFNDAATAYNIQRNSFPTALVAGAFGHARDAALLVFDNEKDIQAAPRIDL
ncbi:LemA family protein [uncultured delta proteobacterium]|uniref:LemA family protein n=1 Tax=uncultured delta proteobacterium TaxID=34034 RepID=A0A212ITF1_9DELT|nr:LemA family protein [uncultured delta proteobacterium]